MSEMTPAELGRWLAEHVMGWRLDELTWFDADGGGHYDAEHVDAYDCGTCCVWHPTSNIAQAIEAARKAGMAWAVGSTPDTNQFFGKVLPIGMYIDVDAAERCTHLALCQDPAEALCRALHAALT